MTDAITSSLVIIAFAIPWVIKLRKDVKKLKADKKSLEKMYQSSSLEIDLKVLNEINRIVHDVIKNTMVDRFLLLSAVNGKDDFNFVSALIEQHNWDKPCVLSFGATSKYIDLKTDNEYKAMLKSIEKIKPYYSLTKDMPASMLKQIYQGEAVKASLVAFLGRAKIDDDNDKLLFCSFATHQEKDFDTNLKMTLSGATARISDLLASEIDFKHYES